VELQSNRAAYFTKWAVADGLLKTPFTLIDVGVQGGEAERWHALGEHLVLHGFDAIEEVVEKLKTESRGQPNRHYHWIAAGNFDGEQVLYYDAENPYSSSFYEQGETRFAVSKPIAQPRRVPVRKLDSLLAEGVIARADFIKVDVEGYEKNVLLGAQDVLKGILGIEAESSFGVSPEYPNAHFGVLLEIALANHQRVFDIEFNRVPRSSFQRALARENRPVVADHLSIGSPAMVNVLFCRNPIEEVEGPSHYRSPPPPLDPDRLIKQMIVYELYGLNDAALDVAERFSDRLAVSIDVEKAVRLLADPSCRTPLAHIKRIRELESQLEQVRQAHVDSIRELEGQLEQVRQAHVDSITEANRVFAAHQQAYVARIMELVDEVKALRRVRERLKRLLAPVRAVVPRPVKRFIRYVAGVEE
jgi:FkbM family methyltransferase